MKRIKYSEAFNRDFCWYLSLRKIFSFDGKSDYIPLVGIGLSAKQAFYLIDTQGKYYPTKHPNILKALIKTKGSINLHIKMYAEDRASGVLPKAEFERICSEINAPEWFYKAVEHQKLKYL